MAWRELPRRDQGAGSLDLNVPRTCVLGCDIRIIVNADDLGSTAPVNDRVFELMARGAVTSATIMANSPCVAGAIEGEEGEAADLSLSGHAIANASGHRVDGARAWLESERG